MKFNKLLWLLLSVFLAASWAWGFWSIEPFDFDEAFYRRVAEEMLVKKDYFWTTYNFKIDTNKPAGYIWLILIPHFLVDADVGQVSAFSARIVSLLFSYLTTLFVYFICRRNALYQMWPWQKVLAFVIAALSCLWFPTIGAASVLIDPALTFFSVLAIFFLNAVVFENSMQNRRFKAFASAFCMFASALLKGPIGIVLPLFFLGIRFLFLQLGTQETPISVRRFFKDAASAGQKALLTFLLSAALLAGYYAVLWNMGAKESVYEFLVTHNLQRAVKPREGHSGQFFYYLIVLLAGGAPLLGMWFAHLRQMVKRRLVLNDPWFAWVIAVVIFYSVVATKLPNYIWPAWPALAMCFLGSLVYEDKTQAPLEEAKVFKVLQILCGSVAFLLGLAFLSLPFLLGRLEWFRIDERALAVVKALGNLPFMVVIGVYVLAGLFFLTAILLYKYKTFSTNSFISLALLGAGINFVIKTTLFPFADSVLTGSVIRLTQHANVLKPELLALVGHQTATAYSFYKGPQIENYSVRSPTPFSKTNVVILTPIWNEDVCLANGFSEVVKDFYMMLCKKP